MKAGWEVRPLGEVAEFVMGQAPAGKDCNKQGNGTPFVKAGEFGESRPAIREWTTDPKKLARSSDVLICVVGATCGKINLGADCAIGRSVAAIRPNPQKLDQFFLHYFLEGKVQEFREGSLGAAQTVISKNMLAEMAFPIPPLEEQKQIVAVLDNAFEGLTRAKENAEANLQNARELFDATLDNCLVQDGAEWPKFELKALGTLTTGGTPKSSEKEQYGNAIPFIKPGHFRTDGSLDYDDVGLSEEAKNGARVVPENSALMVCIGATIGKSGFSDREVTTNQQVNSLSPFEGLHHYFAYLHFITPTFQKQVTDNSGQATLPIINKSKWGALKMGVPQSIADQQIVVSRMQEMKIHVDLALEEYTNKLTDIADLRQSLLQKAFAGELT